jgi:hypothetical protein
MGDRVHGIVRGSGCTANTRTPGAGTAVNIGPSYGTRVYFVEREYRAGLASEKRAWVRVLYKSLDPPSLLVLLMSFWFTGGCVLVSIT